MTTAYARYRKIGKAVEFEIKATGTTGGTTSTAVTFTAPVAPANADTVFAAWVDDGAGVSASGLWDSVNTYIEVHKYDNSNWGLGASRVILVSGSYEIA